LAASAQRVGAGTSDIDEQWLDLIAFDGQPLQGEPAEPHFTSWEACQGIVDGIRIRISVTVSHRPN